MIEAMAMTTTDLKNHSIQKRFGSRNPRPNRHTCMMRVERIVITSSAPIIEIQFSGKRIAPRRSPQGRIVNPKTARSQMLGGMTWGLSMALHEESVLDPRFGDYVNHDFAEYHIATNADVRTVEVAWIDEDDPHVNPIGAKGIGELAIVGTAAAIANAVYHATGIRVRDLPITLDKLLR